MSVLPKLAALAVLSLSAATAAQDTPVFDDSYLVIDLDNQVENQSGTQPAEVSYFPKLRMRFFGAADGDAVIVRWKQGRRALAEIRCPLQARGDSFETAVSQRCWTRDSPELTASGEVQVELVFVDDSTDARTTVRTLEVNVGRYWHWDRRVGNRDVHSVRYQVRADDLMGLSTIWFQQPDSTQTYGNVYIYFWASLADGNSNYRDASWRCSLNGTRVPELNVGSDVVESLARIEIDNDQMQGRERTTTHYNYRQMWIKPQMIWDPTNGNNSGEPWRYNVSAHPGRYECQLRDNGETVRTFAFTVTTEGRVAAHPLEGPTGLTFRPDAHLIETGFPARNRSELVFDRDAVRGGVAFGREWSGPAPARAWLDALPRSYGAGEPRAPRGAPRARR